MADVEYVEALTGREIVNDLLVQIDEKLSRDCNLRDTDSYQGGYSAKVTIHLEAYGMDTVIVEASVTTGKPQDSPDELLDDVLEIPVEPALDQVRERSGQPVPTLAVNESGQPEIRQRRYTRRAGGGATGDRV